MSDAVTNVAAALTEAQACKVARAGKTQTGKSAATTRAQKFSRAIDARPVITFEAAKAMCPTDEQMAIITTGFGLDDVDYAEIRDSVEASFAAMAKALEPVLVTEGFDGQSNNKALEIHLQRIAGAYVGSAFGAATFYESKRQQARELNSQFNEHREEDRMGIDGLANRAQGARQFAASLSVKAYATLAAAEGALSAYAHIIGSEWKPYTSPTDNGAAVSRDAASAQAAALGI